MNSIMELLVWEGDYGLVSLNTECTLAIAYVKLVNAPVEIRFLRNPYFYAKQEFPLFRHGNLVLSEFEDLKNYLNIRNYAPVVNAPGKQAADAFTIVNMVKVNLKPLLEYLMWIDDANYEELTRAWYVKVMPFPFNFLYPHRRRLAASAYVRSFFYEENETDAIQKIVFNNAIEGFSYLTLQLQRSRFLCGNHMSALDTIVYAYLAPLIKLPFPCEQVRTLLGGWPELAAYVRHVDMELFPGLEYTEKYIMSKTVAAKRKGKCDETAAHLTLKIFMCAFVACAMTGYAASKNLINFEKCRQLVLEKWFKSSMSAPPPDAL